MPNCDVTGLIEPASNGTQLPEKQVRELRATQNLHGLIASLGGLF
jgi:hypothetical protein